MSPSGGERGITRHTLVRNVGNASTNPELRKKLREVENKQKRWIGRRIEAHDMRDAPVREKEQASAASAPATPTHVKDGLEQLTVGPSTGPSGQGGEEFEAAQVPYI